MLSKTQTAALWGLDAEMVTVEADLQKGLPAFYLVGLADTTIKEAKERIRAAILNSGYHFPKNRITINLAPAGKHKEGSHFDLPIAVSILSLEQGNAQVLKDMAFIGELSLNGEIRSVRGALPLAIGLREQGIQKLMFPKNNLDEIALLTDIELYPVTDLQQAADHLTGKNRITPYKRKKKNTAVTDNVTEDFSDVIGQNAVKRALTIAAAGNHGILMLGSPGCGKTMMAKRLPAILPDMTYEEQLESTKIHSIGGLLDRQTSHITKRPFRAPHYNITKAAFLGGGKRPMPGELSLAHNGVLFLDELGQFEHTLLELMRQPMEEERVLLNRHLGTASFPSRYLLIAAANPCPCGYYGDETHLCTCTEKQISSYMSKFSGPLIDRIDLHIKVFPVDYKKIETRERPMSSREMKIRVEQAAALQKQRYKRSKILFNSRLPENLVDKICPLGVQAQTLMEQAYENLGLNVRTYYKIIRVARTIADLEGETQITVPHIAEALQYRGLTNLYRRNI